MPVQELLRGLFGALLAVLLTVCLTLCLAETRVHLGRTEYGVWWLPGKSWTPYFCPVWYAVLFNSLFNVIAGYLVADKVRTPRAALFAVGGAAVLLVLGLVLAIGSPLPQRYGQAGWNTLWYCTLVMWLVGAYAGAAIEAKTPLRERRRKRTRSTQNYLG